MGVRRFGAGLFNSEVRNSIRDIVMDLAVDDLDCGGLYSWPERVCLHPFSYVEEQALRASGWNDLRLKFSNDRVSVELNGWNPLDNIVSEDRRELGRG